MILETMLTYPLAKNSQSLFVKILSISVAELLSVYGSVMALQAIKKLLSRIKSLSTKNIYVDIT